MTKSDILDRIEGVANSIREDAVNIDELVCNCSETADLGIQQLTEIEEYARCVASDASHLAMLVEFLKERVGNGRNFSKRA